MKRTIRYRRDDEEEERGEGDTAVVRQEGSGAAEEANNREQGGDDNGGNGSGGGRSPSPEPKRRAVLSTVRAMPIIETRTRAAEIAEMKKNEKKEDVVRAKRLLGSLLVGTLSKFTQEAKTAKEKVHVQIEKQREAERRHEQNYRAERERRRREEEEKAEIIRKKRELSERMQQKKEIRQFAEEKEKHFRRLQCFIQTATKPPLFYLPAKHTLRTLELLKDSSKKIDKLIEMRQEEMQRELQRIGTCGDSDNEDEEAEATAGKVKSTVVVAFTNPSAISAPSRADDDSNSSARGGRNGGAKDEDGSGEYDADDDGGIMLDESGMAGAPKVQRTVVVLNTGPEQNGGGTPSANEKEVEGNEGDEA